MVNYNLYVQQLVPHICHMLRSNQVVLFIKGEGLLGAVILTV